MTATAALQFQGVVRFQHSIQILKHGHGPNPPSWKGLFAPDRLGCMWRFDPLLWRARSFRSRSSPGCARQQVAFRSHRTACTETGTPKSAYEGPFSWPISGGREHRAVGRWRNRPRAAHRRSRCWRGSAPEQNNRPRSCASSQPAKPGDRLRQTKGSSFVPIRRSGGTQSAPGRSGVQ